MVDGMENSIWQQYLQCRQHNLKRRHFVFMNFCAASTKNSAATMEIGANNADSTKDTLHKSPPAVLGTGMKP